ncbi:hypothetical protein [Klebsiella pneumoniae]
MQASPAVRAAYLGADE